MPPYAQNMHLDVVRSIERERARANKPESRHEQHNDVFRRRRFHPWGDKLLPMLLREHRVSPQSNRAERERESASMRATVIKRNRKTPHARRARETLTSTWCENFPLRSEKMCIRRAYAVGICSRCCSSAVVPARRQRCTKSAFDCLCFEIFVVVVGVVDVLVVLRRARVFMLRTTTRSQRWVVSIAAAGSSRELTRQQREHRVVFAHPVGYCGGTPFTTSVLRLTCNAASCEFGGSIFK